MPSNHATQIKNFHTQQGHASKIPEDRRSILLTTVNRETGAPRTTWVEFFLDEDRRILVVALPDGSRNKPGWYDDLLAEPQVTLENDAFTIEAHAVRLGKSERDAALDRAAELDPVLRRERSRAPEPPPVVALNPLHGRPVGATWSSSLKLIHDAFAASWRSSAASWHGRGRASVRSCASTASPSAAASVIIIAARTTSYSR